MKSYVFILLIASLISVSCYSQSLPDSSTLVFSPYECIYEYVSYDAEGRIIATMAKKKFLGFVYRKSFTFSYPSGVMKASGKTNRKNYKIGNWYYQEDNENKIVVNKIVHYSRKEKVLVSSW